MKLQTLFTVIAVSFGVVAHAGDDLQAASVAQQDDAGATISAPHWVGSLAVRLDRLVDSLLKTQMDETSEPTEINNLVLLTSNDDPDAYDWVL